MFLNRAVARNLILLKNSGAPGEIRTPDHLVRSQILYPAELRAQDPHYPRYNPGRQSALQLNGSASLSCNVQSRRPGDWPSDQ